MHCNMIRFRKPRFFKVVVIFLLIIMIFVVYRDNPVDRGKLELHGNFTNFYPNYYRSTHLHRKTSLFLFAENISEMSPVIKDEVPLVLFWTRYYGKDPLGYLEGFDPSSCPSVCIYTGKRNHFQDADAVLFHSGNLEKNDTPFYHNYSRPPNQVWIYNNLESPINTEPGTREILTSFQYNFNWTMTYRPDSDIFHPYGQVIKTVTPIPNGIWDEMQANWEKQWKKKKHIAVWPVSHCVTKSKREILAAQLQEYVPIDIIGFCGNKSYCKRVGLDYDKCFKKFEQNYKFILAFENSLCEGYITEKFFNPMKHDIVPVVYTGGDLSWVGAPPGSYIDTRDFNSSQELGEYLVQLSGDMDRYVKYFEHKRNYIVTRTGQFSWCRLCDKLYKQREKVKVGEGMAQWYPDIVKWYESGGYANVNEKPTGRKACVD